VGSYVRLYTTSRNAFPNPREFALQLIRALVLLKRTCQTSESSRFHDILLCHHIPIICGVHRVPHLSHILSEWVSSSSRHSALRIPSPVPYLQTCCLNFACQALSELPCLRIRKPKALEPGWYQLGQKTTIVDCVSNRPLPCDLYSALCRAYTKSACIKAQT
jgi:hypothetical protein